MNNNIQKQLHLYECSLKGQLRVNLRSCFFIAHLLDKITSSGKHYNEKLLEAHQRSSHQNKIFREWLK